MWLASIVLASLTTMGCGDDEGGGPVMMQTGGCTPGEVRTCVDNAKGCSGRRVCMSGGTFGSCLCYASPDGGAGQDGGAGTGGTAGTGGSMSDPDASTNDASMMDDASMNEPDAQPPDECGGSCVPEAPNDFDGPFLTFIGGNDPPSCGGAYDDEGPTGGAGLVAPEADCSTCSCESTGNSCATFVNLAAGGNASCGGGCSNAFNQTCAELDIACLDAETSTRVQTSLPPSAGPCAPATQEPVIEPAELAQLAYTCAPDRELERDGCESDELCAPDGPFDGEYCVTREGTHDCPDGPYSDRRVFYGGIDDDRGCSECTCDRDCDYTVELFPDADDTCDGTPAATLSIESPNQTAEASSCEVAPVGSGGTLRAAFSVSGSGTCDASGGEPEGDATGSDPVTFCCLQ